MAKPQSEDKEKKVESSARLKELNHLDELITSNEAKRKKSKRNRHTYFLEEANILAEYRSVGDSRYVYGKDGFNFWVHASGYMYGNEGFFSIFNRRKGGDEPVIAFLGLVEGKFY